MQRLLNSLFWLVTALAAVLPLVTNGQSADTIRLNGVLPALGDVTDFKITPDNSRVIYLADQNQDQVFELFSVPIGGGPVIQLNGNLVENGNVMTLSRRIEATSFAITPDSSRVVYTADQNQDDVVELFSVSVTGGSVTKLNDVLVTDGDVEQFLISPASDRVVYLADQDVDTVLELYSVPIDGGTVVKLHTDITSKSGVFPDFEISGSNNLVVYSANLTGIGSQDLFSVAITGGTATQLNNIDQSGNFIEVSPDEMLVLYTAVENGSSGRQLFLAPINGGTPVILGGSIGRASFSPDSQRVVFTLNSSLFSVPITGGTSTLLSPGLVSNGFQVSADSGTVVFGTSPGTNDNMTRIYSVPITGGTPISISGDLLPNRVPSISFSSGDFIINKDSQAVIFRATESLSDRLKLFTSAVSGGPITTISPDQDSDISVFELNESEDKVFFIKDALSTEPSSTTELLFVSPEGGDTVRVSSDLVAGGDLTGIFQLSPNDEFVVYRGEQNTAGQFELFSIRTSDLEQMSNESEICFPISIDDDNKVAII